MISRWYLLFMLNSSTENEHRNVTQGGVLRHALSSVNGDPLADQQPLRKSQSS
jgi:hypothetical protein